MQYQDVLVIRADGNNKEISVLKGRADLLVEELERPGVLGLLFGDEFEVKDDAEIKPISRKSVPS